MDILVVLAEHANEVVPRCSLLDAAWSAQAVSDERLTHVIAELRRAFQHENGRADVIETVPKRGYRLVGQIQSLLPQQISSIAVLPLENVIGDPEQEYFADGMTEALITELSKIGALRVTSRQSVMQLKNTDLSMPEIAKRLNVDAVAEGSVLQIGDRVRITVQLIDGETDLHLWGDSYDRDLKDVLALHSEVARSIAREIRIAVTPEEETLLTNARRVNPEAHRRYLLGQYHVDNWVPAEQDIAIRYFKEAIEFDPEFAEAYAGLAKGYEAVNFFGYMKPGDYVDKWRSAIKQALKLDGNLPNAHRANAGINYYYEWNWAEAEAVYRRAISLNRSFDEAYHYYAWFLLAMNRPDDAHASINRALELNPLAINAYLTASDVYYMSRQYDRAIAQLKEILELSPSASFAYSRLGWSYLQKGGVDEAITAMETAVGLSPEATEHRWVLGHAYGAAGQSANARQVLHYLQILAKERHVPAHGFALVHLGLGKYDQALDLLEQAYLERDSWIVYLQVWPLLDPIRGDRRFQALLDRMKFPN